MEIVKLLKTSELLDISCKAWGGKKDVVREAGWWGELTKKFLE